MSVYLTNEHGALALDLCKGGPMCNSLMIVG